MSKTVRLEEAVYARLEALRAWKQSYSQVVERLLDIHDQAVKMARQLQDYPEYQAFLKTKEETPCPPK